MALDDALLEAEEKMLKTTEVVQHEFTSIRTGRRLLRPGGEHHGERLRRPDEPQAARRDHHARAAPARPPGLRSSNVTAIEKAIRESKLGVSPIVDGKVIRLPIPELSEERRREIGQAREEDGGGRARGHPPRATRRDGGDQETPEGAARSARTTSSAPSRRFRSSRTSTARRSTASLRRRKRTS